MCAISLTGPASAQDVAGAIEGRVVDEVGAPVAQANIRVTPSGATASLRSDDRGRFRFLTLPVGTYRIDIDAIGHAPLRRAGIVVALGRTSFLGDVVLRTDAIAVEGVEAAAEAPGLDLRSASSGGSMAASSFRQLPVDRDYQSILATLPQANASGFGDRVNFDGLTGAEAQYYVDGVRTVEPPGNSVSTSIPYNQLRAIEVRGAGYEAEYGGSGGAIVNAVTATGGDEFRGQVYGFAANRLLATHDGTLRLPNSTTGYHAWDAGLSLGGPIRTGVLWYQLGYGPGVDTRDLHVTGLGKLQDRRVSHRFAGRLTWRASHNTTLDLSTSGDPSERDQIGGVVIGEATTFGNVDPLLANQPRSSVHFALHGTHTLGARAFAEWTVSHSDFDYALEPRTPRGWSDSLYIESGTSYAEGGFGTAVSRDASRDGVRASMSWERKRHSFKAGAGFEDEWARESIDTRIIRHVSANLWRYTSFERETDNHIRVPSAFLQDSWQAASWLRLNAGLRWNGEWWITSGGDVGQRITDLWQPRLGFVLHREHDQRSRLFGSAGRFHQQTRLNVLQYCMQDVAAIYQVLDFGHDPRTDPSGGNPSVRFIIGRQPENDDLRGAIFDEYQVGAEHVFTSGIRTSMRAIDRRQRDGIVGVISAATMQPVFGNPGHGALSAYPKIERKYQALEWSAEREGRVSVRGSYVLSRSVGNYEGYWQQTIGDNDPTGAGSFVAFPNDASFLKGTLPNDRPHVLKLSGSARVGHGVTVGSLMQFASGTPLSELGTSFAGPPFYVQLQPRGSVGRSSWLYDLDFRIAWEPGPVGTLASPRLLLDVYHVGNPRREVLVDQVHYRDVAQTTINPNYGKPLAYQPGAAVRVGFEASF